MSTPGAHRPANGAVPESALAHPALRHGIDALVVLAIIAFAWEPNFAHGFLNYNESGQHLAAAHALQGGGVLFRDVFAQYGPLHYDGPLLAFAVFGTSVASLRGYFLAGEIASLLAAFALARTAFSGAGALRDVHAAVWRLALAWGAGIVLVMHAHHPFWSTRWGGFRFAFVYATLAALLRAPAGGSAWLAAAGVCFALAFLHTYDAGAVAGLGVALYFAHAFVQARRSGDTLPWRGLAFFGIGAAVTALPFAARLVVQGTLGLYLDQLPLFSPGRAWIQPLLPGDLSLTVLAPALIFAVAFVVLLAAARRARWDAARHLPLLLLSGCGAALYAAAFRALRGPQFETSLPLAILTGCALLAELLRARTGTTTSAVPRVFAVAAGFSLVIALALPIRAYEGNALSWARYQQHKASLLPRHRGASFFEERYREPALPMLAGTRTTPAQADEIEAVVAAIQAQTRPGEAIFAYPDLGIFHALADRPSASRFQIAILAAARNDWARELRDTLEAAPPRAVLRGTGLSTLARATRQRREYLPEIGAWLDARYRPSARLGGIELLLRRGAEE